ncbi:MAG: hypothetical protein HQL26_06995 [Candidatus Omnitrophica bacterium]|nr:hypothetical protein [Candidatus Omnitrophota bacterium]
MSKYRTSNSLFVRKLISIFLIFTFIFSSINIPQYAYAQTAPLMPVPGTMVGLTPPFNPPVLKGIKVYPDNPLRFDFILDNGFALIQNDPERPAGVEGLQQEAKKLIKYFLASLTVPENDLWVNLSPYEKGRIVPKEFGQTEMGRDLLAQDYLLKQITASLMYPENEIGREFWDKIYKKLYSSPLRGEGRVRGLDIPIDTFNKVWIVPEKAVVFENGSTGSPWNAAYVVESKLKVMLESDYLAASKNIASSFVGEGPRPSRIQESAKQIIREVIIPAIEKEVNTGKNFAQLRQVYNSLILAAWYKKKIKESLLSKIYVDKNKITGVNIDDPKAAEKIWAQYVESFKKGVYNYIKEEYDPNTQQIIPKKYFSGGFDAAQLFGNKINSALTITKVLPSNKANEEKQRNSVVSVNMDPVNFWGKIQKRLTPFIFAASLLTTSYSALGVQFFNHELEGHGKETSIALVQKGDSFISIAQAICKKAKKSFTEEQIKRVADAIKEDNAKNLKGENLSPGENLNINKAEGLVWSIDLLNNSQIVATSKIAIAGNQPIDVYFIRPADKKEFNNFVAFASIETGQLFMDVDQFVEQLNVFKKIIKNPRSVWAKLYQGKSDQYIFEHYMAEMIYHEYVHTLTTPIIRSKKFDSQTKEFKEYLQDDSHDIYRVAEEVSAYLAQASVSEEPAMALTGLVDKIDSQQFGTDDYAAAGFVLMRQIMTPLGYEQYLLNTMKQQQGREITADEKKGLHEAYESGSYAMNEYRGVLAKFLLQNPKDQLRQSTHASFKNIFGIDLPGFTQFTIPRQVIEDYSTRGAEHKLIDAGDVIKDQAMIAGKLKSKIIRALAVSLMAYYFTGSVKGAEFTDISFPYGYKTTVAKAQTGDTPESVVRRFVDLQVVAQKKYMPLGDTVWDEFVSKYGLIDNYGVLQEKFIALKDFNEFKSVIGAMNEEYAKKIYDYLKLIQEHIYKLSPDEIAQITSKISKNLQRKIANGKFVPGEIVDLKSATEELRFISTLKSDDIVGSTTVTINKNPVEIYFVNKDTGVRLAYTSENRVFMNLGSFRAIPGETKEIIAEATKESISQLQVRTFPAGIKDSEIFFSKLRELLAHEFAHTLTTALVESGAVKIYPAPVSDNEYMATMEVSGILGQIAGSDHPVKTFAEFKGAAQSLFFEGGQQYIIASQTISDRMLELLHFGDYVLKRENEKRDKSEKEPSKPLTADDFSNLKKEAVTQIMTDLKQSGYINAEGKILQCPLLGDAREFKINGKYSDKEREMIYDRLLRSYDLNSWGVSEDLKDGAVFKEDAIEFFLKLNPDAVRQAARDVHKAIFGVDLSTDPVTIPDFVKEYSIKKYFPAEETTKSHKDQAMIVGQLKYKIIRALAVSLMAYYFTGAVKGAEYTDISFPYGYKTTVAKTQQGDTPESVVKRFIDLQVVAQKKLMPLGDTVWDDFVKYGFIDNFGVLQEKFLALKNFEDFKKVIGPMKEEYAKKIYDYLKLVQEHIIKLSPDEIAQLTSKISKNSVVKIKHGKFSPDEIVDLKSATEELSFILQLKSDDIVGSTTVSINKKPVEIYFVNKDTGVHLAYTSENRVFMNLGGFRSATTDTKQIIAQAKKNSISQLDVRAFPVGTTDSDIFFSKLKELLAHEFAHTLTTALVESGAVKIYPAPVSDNEYMATMEVSGILGQIAGSDHPVKTFAEFKGAAQSLFFEGGQQYIIASRTISERMLELLHFDEYVLKREHEKQDKVKKEPSKPLKADDFFGFEKEAVPKIMADLQGMGYIDNKGNILQCPLLGNAKDFKIKGHYSAEEREMIYRYLLRAFDHHMLGVLLQLQDGIASDEDEVEFFLGLNPDAVRQAARDVHKAIFGVDLPTNPVTIPDFVKEYSIKKYFPAEEKTNSHKDQAMTNEETAATNMNQNIEQEPIPVFGMSPWRRDNISFKQITDVGRLNAAGVRKLIGYIDSLPAPEVEQIIKYYMAKGFGVKAYKNGEISINGGAVFVWDRVNLQKLINQNLGILKAAGIPSDKDGGISADDLADYIAKHNVSSEKYPEAYATVGIAFADSRFNQQALAFNKGGIDLNPVDKTLQIQSNGDVIKFNIDPAMLEQLKNASGFSPIIINITPLKDLKMFLGI